MATKGSNTASSGKNGKGGSTAATAGGDTAGAFQSARAKTGSTVKQTGRKISENPVGAVLSGFAVGAVLGAVIPATRRERAALQPIGQKISEAARDAARQAAEKGRDKLNEVTGQVMTQVGAKMIDAVAPPAESSNATA
jgi:hypothetical protein